MQHPDAAFPHILQLCVRAGYVALQGAVLADGNIPLPGAIGNINPVVPAVDNVAVARTAVGSAAGRDDINGGKTGICLSREAADRIALRDPMCGNRLGRVSGDKRFAVGFYDALADDIAVIQRPLCEVVAPIQIPLAASAIARRVDLVHAGKHRSQLLVDLFQRAELLQQIQAEARTMCWL